MTQKLLTVFGATGNQGGSVIKAFLANKELSSTYKIRGITRDVTKPAAKALADQGVEVVKADLEDPASLDAALKGSDAVFGVTNYWEKGSKQAEIDQGKAIADASKKAGVKHLVWSSLPNTLKLTEGKLTHIDHFDSKADVQDYIEQIKGDDLIASYYMPGYFASNFKTGIVPGQDGALTWNAPFDATETKLPVIDVQEDTGKYVAGIILKGKEANGVSVHAVSEWKTPQEAVEIISKQVGKEIKFNQVPPEVFASFLPMPEYLANELTENMILIRDFSYYGVGEDKKKAEHDKWLLKGTKTVTFADYLKTAELAL